MKINPIKLQKFCHLWSFNTPREIIQRELNIKKAQYYRYINAAKNIVDDFLLGVVDHGLVLEFKNSLERVQRRAEKMDKISQDEIAKYSPEMDPKEKTALTRIIKISNETEKLYNVMLDNKKIVNSTMKTLNKVIVKYSLKKK